MRYHIFERFLIAGALLAILAATPAWADDDAQYVPNAANGCGRLGVVSLAPIPFTRYLAPYPEDARQRGQKGNVLLRVLVDKYGFARNPEVVISSGYAQLDQAAIDSIKDRWRWEPPPPECAESGVTTSVAFDWGLVHNPGDIQPVTIYLESDFYPAQERARKRGGEGKVEYTISRDNKVTDARVTASTGSPDLDAAMLAKIRTIRFPYGVTSTSYTATKTFEFVPEKNPYSLKVLMGPAIIPSPAELPGKAPHLDVAQFFPPPSLANGCGRNAPASLDPSPTNMSPRYPIEAAGAGKQGRTVLDVLVDKSGTASEVAVAETSGSPILDQAAVKGAKGLWHFLALPPECADQGAHLRRIVDWFQGEAANFRVMAGDPVYPAEALAGKLSGIGTVQIKHSQDGQVEFAKVLTSTNSDILDAAMIKIITGAHFTPGTKAGHTSLTTDADIAFVGDPGALRAAAAAPVRRIAPALPPPSAANDCGRGGDVYLAPVDNSHVLVPIPMVTAVPATHLHAAVTFRAQGALKMQVLVDKDGKAASVTVAASSAPPEMERAVTGTVKENYRWATPPPECADRGVMLNVNYVYTWAPDASQIYADDPAYPAAAQTMSMGGAGVVEIRYHRDQIDETKVLISTNSPELDAAMVKLISDRLLSVLKASPYPGSYAAQIGVMFMPGFVSSPKQLTAQRLHEQVAAPP